MQSRQPADEPDSAVGDHVDRVRALWAQEAPDVDTTPLAVIARLGRIQAYIDSGLDRVFSRHGLTRGSWDVLASLRRVGEPYQLAPTELYRMQMRTSGAITHTLRALEHAGLVDRLPNPVDGRSLLVRLTDAGCRLVDRVVPIHLDNERRMLDPLTTDEQARLADLLRTLLVAFERTQPVPSPQPRLPDGVGAPEGPTVGSAHGGNRERVSEEIRHEDPLGRVEHVAGPARTQRE